MKIIHKFLVCVAALTLTISYFVFNEPMGVLRIELVSCTQDGFINGLREKINPKNFWISQNVLFEMELEREWDFQNTLDICREENDLTQKQRCFDYYNNFRDSVKKCHITVKKRCRENGGLC